LVFVAGADRQEDQGDQAAGHGDRRAGEQAQVHAADERGLGQVDERRPGGATRPGGGERAAERVLDGGGE
jgi:hypothetical protein